MQDNKEIKKFLQNWAKIVAKYQTPDKKKAILQIITSFGPFIAVWVLMYFSLDWHYGITLALAILNAFFLVRIFIIQHDCGHQAFFGSKKANNAVGLICSFFSTMPFKYWARSHAFHHSHCGQLEMGVRDIGDVHVKTVEEYRALSPFKRFGYRVYRSMPVMLVFGPIYYTGVLMRFPIINKEGWKKTRLSQVFNNVYMYLVWALLAAVLGWKEFFMVQVPIIFLFFVIAVWFFYVQHQHEDTYKQWKENWEYLLAAIKGSTYYKLPKVFQWLTGNIGFHHIHHLSSKIPNYNLEKCAKENPIINKYTTTLTFTKSLKTMFNHLWDEQQQKMISFREFYRLEKMKKAMA